MFGIVLYNLFNLEARAVKKMLISLQQFLLFFVFLMNPSYFFWTRNITMMPNNLHSHNRISFPRAFILTDSCGLEK